MSDFQDTWTKFMDFCGRNSRNFSAFGFFVMGMLASMMADVCYQSNERIYAAGHFCLVIWMLGTLICIPHVYGPPAKKHKFKSFRNAIIYWLVMAIIVPLIAPLVLALVEQAYFSLAQVACLTLSLHLYNFPKFARIYKDSLQDNNKPS